MATKLTEAELANARAALQTAAEADSKALTDQILFEQRRDDLAYSLIQTAASETPKRRLSFGDAQAMATEHLRSPAAQPVQKDAETGGRGDAEKKPKEKPATA